MGNLTKESAAERRAASARALSAFGVAPAQLTSIGQLRTIRSGGPATIFTVGYERRTGEELIARLRDTGIDVLADIREKPISRRADFRAEALRELCAEGQIDYQPWPRLGSTGAQRDGLRLTGDIANFHAEFRSYAEGHLMPEIERLSAEVRRRQVALLCYERAHEDCHRMIVAELIAGKTGAGIVAIV